MEYQISTLERPPSDPLASTSSKILDPSFYLKIATRLKKDTNLTEIFERHADLGKIKDEWVLQELIQDLSLHLGVDLSQAVDYFSNTTNKDDSNDVIQMANFNEEMFRRRLGNFCLTKACSLDPNSDTLPEQYISAYRNAASRQSSKYDAEDPPELPLVDEASPIESASSSPHAKLQQEQEETVAAYLLEATVEAELFDAALEVGWNAEDEVSPKNSVKQGYEEEDLEADYKGDDSLENAIEANIQGSLREQIAKAADEPEEYWLDPPEHQIIVQKSTPSHKRKGQVEVKPITYAVSEVPLAEGIMDRSTRILHKDEIYQFSDDLDLDYVAKDPRPTTWLTPSLKRHADRILESFMSQSTSTLDEVSRADCLKVFKEALSICEVSLTQAGKRLFLTLLTDSRDFLSYLDFIDLLEEWAGQYNPEASDIATKIRQTIAEYEAMLQEVGSEAESINLAAMILTLKEQLKKQISRGDRPKQKVQRMDSQTKALKEIFAFYARQQKIIGADSTFDEITHNVTVWTLSKFYKFCTDFEVMGRTRGSQRRLDKEELTAVFRKHWNYAKLLSEDRFLDVLERIAEAYFNQTYDKVSGQPPVAEQDAKAKLGMLLDYLGVGNPEIYLQKMKGFGHAFSKEKAGYRIPEDDLSKKYQYRNLSKQALKRRQRQQDSSADPSLISLNKLKGVPSKLQVSSSASAKAPPKPDFSRLNPKPRRDQDDEEDVGKFLGIDESDLYDEAALSRDISARAHRQLPDENRYGQILKMHERRMESGLKALERVRRVNKGVVH